MKKILILANNDIGLYRFRKELIEELIKLGNEVYISLPYGANVDKLKDMGCKFFDTKIDRRGMNPINDLILLFNYFKLLNQIKPDLVLTYTIKPNIYGGLICRIKNIDTIANITGLGSSMQRDNIMKKILLYLYKISISKSTCVFFQNKNIEKFFINNNILQQNYKVIPGSGVNLSENRFEKYPSDNSIEFTFIGRVMKEKGIDEFFYIAEKIKSLYDNVEFHIIGFYEENYKSKIENLEENNIIKYYGFQEDIHNFIKESHCVILPSYHEGLSNVLLEAASTGRPSIASDIPGCNEVIDDGKTGYLFEVKNKDELFDKVKEFIELPISKKEEMGINARKKVEHEFDRQLVVQQYIDIINTEEVKGKPDVAI